MRVALFISGRLKCYEQRLLPFLEKVDYDVDLFISINGHRDAYHNQAIEKLSKWLKEDYINPYVVPQDYVDIFCLLYTSPSPRDYAASRMPSSA